MQALTTTVNLWKTTPLLMLVFAALLAPHFSRAATLISLPAIAFPQSTSQRASIALPTISLPKSTPQTSATPVEPLLPKLEQATVHIVCATNEGAQTRYVSGTGVIVDQRGVILTNAHILASAALLKNKTTCTARTGNPSKNPLPITLVYISPHWIEGYGKKIASDTLEGTGEYDIALAVIAKAADSEKKYAFVELPLDQSLLKPKAEVLACSYPAEFLGGEIVSTSLYRNCSYITTGEGFTFSKKNTFDALSLGGTILARAGSSGGPIITLDGRLAGLISTSSREHQTSERMLTAITVGYMQRYFAESMNESLASYIKKPIDELVMRGKAQIFTLQKYF